MKPKSNRAFLSGNIGTVCVCWGLPKFPGRRGSVDLRPFRPGPRRSCGGGPWAPGPRGLGGPGHLGTEMGQRERARCTVLLMERNACLRPPQTPGKREGLDPEPFGPTRRVAGAPLRAISPGRVGSRASLKKRLASRCRVSEDWVGKPSGLRFSRRPTELGTPLPSENVGRESRAPFRLGRLRALALLVPGATSDRLDPFSRTLGLGSYALPAALPKSSFLHRPRTWLSCRSPSLKIQGNRGTEDYEEICCNWIRRSRGWFCGQQDPWQVQDTFV